MLAWGVVREAGETIVAHLSCPLNLKIAVATVGLDIRLSCKERTCI